MTVWLATNGAAMVEVLSTWISYATAFATSVPLNATGWATPMAMLAGLCSVGAPIAGFTVSVALRLVPPNEPVLLVAVGLDTPDVVIVNVALVAPAATVTLAGTATAAELSDSVTRAPPDGAAVLRLTVPVEELPPTTVVGLTVSAVNVADCGWVTPRAANTVRPHADLAGASRRAGLSSSTLTTGERPETILGMQNWR